MFSYIMEEIVNLFSQFQRIRFMYIRKLMTMQRYMHYKQVNFELTHEILRFYEYLYVE